MEKIKEKRVKGIQTRTCICCGKQWNVRSKKESIKSQQRFCPECIQTLSKKEKQHIWRVNCGNYHEESRECINCGKTWIVEVKNNASHSRTKYFCCDCNEKLSNKEKTQILRLKLEGFHEKEKAQRRASYKRNHIHNIVANARERALAYGYEFDIQDSDIVIPERCPLLNVPFILGEKGNYEYTPTIDRIDNSKGYTKDNIWIITKKANAMKNSASFEELNTFCTNILRYSLNNREKESIEPENKESLG
jgi:hypothetical protein